jgi:hypothetical protein
MKAAVASRAKKKPAWSNTLRYSATPAYSSTGPPALSGCPLSSHPTTSALYASQRVTQGQCWNAVAVSRCTGIRALPRASSCPVPGLRRRASGVLLSVPEDSSDVAGGWLPLRSVRVRDERGGAEGDGRHASRALPYFSMGLTGPLGRSRARGQLDIRGLTKVAAPPAGAAPPVVVLPLQAPAVAPVNEPSPCALCLNPGIAIA